MARYTADSKERVRDAVDMVDLVGSRTELRRAGADSYSGLCPFHDERTPSFSVKPSEKVYYCFGCQASGDAFTFVMETEGTDFPGALELLADRYAVTLELEDEDPGAAERRRRRERLLELLERTSGYYERYLWEAKEATRARDYLAGRGLSEELLREFRVGYAPSAWDRVLLASRRGGFSEAELLAAGLVQRSRERPGSVYDRFRSRIMFPLCDQRGRVLGFGARTLSGEGAKYLNSSDGDVYHKGKHLYAAHLARAAAAKAGSIVLCEGYTDVIALHQAGVHNSVGLMGTALTDEQVGLLARLAPTVVLALDADGAGQEAMLKAARLAAKQSFELRVVPLPAGSDPADVLQREGAEAVPALVGRAVAFVRFQVERIIAAGDVTTAEGRDRILGELAPVFGEIGVGAMREELEREVAGRVGISEKLVERLLAPSAARAAGGPVGAGQRPAAVAGGALDASARTERAFLELCIALPDLGETMLAEADLDALFASPSARAAAAHLRGHLRSPSAGVEDGDLAALLAELSVRAAAQGSVSAQLELMRRQLELDRIERAIAAARAGGEGGLTALMIEREGVKRELDEWLTRSLEKTGAGVR